MPIMLEKLYVSVLKLHIEFVTSTLPFVPWLLVWGAYRQVADRAVLYAAFPRNGEIQESLGNLVHVLFPGL